jgi:hypothetical protein
MITEKDVLEPGDILLITKNGPYSSIIEGYYIIIEVVDQHYVVLDRPWFFCWVSITGDNLKERATKI